MNDNLNSNPTTRPITAEIMATEQAEMEHLIKMTNCVADEVIRSGNAALRASLISKLEEIVQSLQQQAS